MCDFLGMFYADKPRALQGIYDSPYLIMGRHALCAEGVAFDGGAAALAFGRMRNAVELKARLEAEGYRSDPTGGISALLLGAYRLWGEECVERIEGPVCCAVIDQDAGRLLVSRDRMGETRLFYAVHGSSVSFASHPAPLLSAPHVTRTVEREGFCEVFGLGPARTPGRTPFRDILELEPGCVLTADNGGNHVRRYFSLEVREHEGDLPSTLETVRAMIERAVRDVAALKPVSMLSGGVDSTVLTALLTRANGAVRSFSVDYEDEDRNFPAGSAWQPDRDAPFVEAAVTALKLRHTRVVLPVKALMNSLGAAMEARGLPGMADIDSSLMLFGRQIAPAGRHALSGECGDEVFGGYPWFHRPDLIDRDGFPWSGSLSLRESVLRPQVRLKLNLRGYVFDRYRDALAELPLMPREAADEARLRALQGLCFRFFMPNLQERAACMLGASGVTVLTPFADERLAQYAYNIPWSIKSLHGREKGVLRQAMDGLIPDELLWRKKSPYPKTYHPEYARLAAEALRATVDDPAAPILQLVDREAVLSLITGPVSPEPWFGQLMAGPQMMSYLVEVNLWMLKYRVEVAL